jgi:hypothetical protein
VLPTIAYRTGLGLKEAAGHTQQTRKQEYMTQHHQVLICNHTTKHIAMNQAEHLANQASLHAFICAGLAPQVT